MVSASYCFSRLEVKGTVLGDSSVGGQELSLESLGPVFCTDAHLGTDSLKGNRRRSVSVSQHSDVSTQEERSVF